MCDCHDLGDYEDLFREEDILYRRVVREDHVVDGKVTAAHCPTKQWNEGLSCDWSLIATPAEAARGHSYLLTFTVAQCKALKIDVRYCPHVNPDDPFYNLAHCFLVLPPQMSKRDIRKLRQGFLEVAVLRRVEPELAPEWYLRAFNWLRSWFSLS